MYIHIYIHIYIYIYIHTYIHPHTTLYMCPHATAILVYMCPHTTGARATRRAQRASLSVHWYMHTLTYIFIR